MSTPNRVAVPHLLKGGYDSIIFGTYGANLSFFEKDLLRHLERATSRIILADARQLQMHLTVASGAVRLANRTYVIAGLRVPREAHVKLILGLSSDRGILAVGSGNLSYEGYASQGECFTAYRWTATDSRDIDAFVGVKSYLDQIMIQGLADQFAIDRLHEALEVAPWLFADSNATSRVRHNFVESLLDQLVAAVRERRVEEMIVHAPFHDPGEKAIERLIHLLRPARVVVLVQPRLTSLEPKSLERLIGRSRVPVAVHSAEAPDKGTWLHGKFVVLHGRDWSIALQGSANLSMAAMAAPFPQGNLELVNLVEGPREDFSDLLNGVVASKGPVNIKDLGVSVRIEDKKESEGNLPLANLTLRGNVVAGVVLGVLELPTALVLLADGQVVEGLVWTAIASTQEGVVFSGTLTEDALTLVTEAGVLRVQMEDAVTEEALPYHVDRLRAVSSGQYRKELLNRIGDLDVHDEEVEDLLIALDRILIIDALSLWRLAHRPTASAPNPDEEDGPHISYDEIDFEAMRSNPRFGQFKRTFDGSSQSDLGLVLTSITERFRLELEHRRQGAGHVGQEGPLNWVQEPVGEDEAEEEAVTKERRVQSLRTRTRKLFRNFIGRFVRGISDPGFVQAVGPAIIVPSYIVFNHLCWKLVQLDLVDREFAISAQTRLWGFFWGSAFGPSYLDSLSEPELNLTLELLDRHHAESVLLASIWSASDEAEENEGLLKQLRDALRGVLVHRVFQPTRRALIDAATVCGSVAEPVEVSDLLAVASWVARYSGESEFIGSVAHTLGVARANVRWRTDLVHRANDRDEHVTYIEVDEAGRLSPTNALAVVSEWRVYDPDQTYFRIREVGKGSLIIVDLEAQIAVYYARRTSDGVRLEIPEPASSEWERALSNLVATAA